MLVAINGWFYDKPYTGIGQYTRNLIKALAPLTVKFELIVFVNASNKEFFDKNSTFNDFSNVRFILIKKSSFENDIIQNLIFEKQILSKAEEYGVDILHTPYLYTPFYSNTKIKHVVTVHDVNQKIFPKYRGGYLRNKLISFRENRLHKVDRIITVSNYSRDDIERYLHIDREKISVIYESVNETFQNEVDVSSTQLVKEKYALPDKYIFYIGGYDYRKNVSSLLKAYYHLKSKECIEEKLILGGIYSPSRKQLKKGVVEDIPSIITALHLENEVRMIGFIPQAELASFYRLCNLSIYPSFYEGFGLPVLEAMYCGAPIVASNTSSIPEIVNRLDLLFNPNDTKSISDKILWVLSDKDRKVYISKWAVQRASHFNWNIAANETLNLYFELINNT